jgi:hypothetical protein
MIEVIDALSDAEIFLGVLLMVKFTGKITSIAVFIVAWATLLGGQTVLAKDPDPLIPNYGEIQISVAQAQPALIAPGQQAIQVAMGVPMMLPNDADGSGADTYVVTEVRRIDGETWLGIYLGSLDWGYVKLDGVTATTFLPSSTPRRVVESSTPRPLVPNFGIVEISAANPQYIYQTPDGAEIHDGHGHWLQVPEDEDGSGADTFIVTSVRTIRGEKWLGIYVGTLRWAWVPLAGVTPLTYIEGL